MRKALEQQARDKKKKKNAKSRGARQGLDRNYLHSLHRPSKARRSAENAIDRHARIRQAHHADGHGDDVNSDRLVPGRELSLQAAVQALGISLWKRCQVPAGGARQARDVCKPQPVVSASEACGELRDAQRARCRAAAAAAAATVSYPGRARGQGRACRLGDCRSEAPRRRSPRLPLQKREKGKKKKWQRHWIHGSSLSLTCQARRARDVRSRSDIALRRRSLLLVVAFFFPPSFISLALALALALSQLRGLSATACVRPVLCW